MDADIVLLLLFDWMPVGTLGDKLGVAQDCSFDFTNCC